MTENAREELDELIVSRRFAEARTLCDTLLTQSPEDLGLLYRAGMLAGEVNALEAAARHFFRILELAPREAPAYVHLGDAYLRQTNICKAAACFQKALEIDPNFGEAAKRLGTVLCIYMTQSRAGVEMLRHAIRCGPDFEDDRVYLRQKTPKPSESPARWRSTLLFALSYNVLCTPEEVLEEHREWDRHYGAPGRSSAYRHTPPSRPVDSNENRPLRVGYVSPDLRRHAVSYFAEPLLCTTSLFGRG